MNDTPDLTGLPGWHPTPLPVPTLKRSFVSGDPTGTRLRVAYFQSPEHALIARAWFGPDAEGPPGHAHGGSMAALLDELMGGVAWAAGHPAVAGELTVRFRNMLPLGTVITATGAIRAVNGRRITVTGALLGDDGTRFAEGEGLFIRLPSDHPFAKEAGFGAGPP